MDKLVLKFIWKGTNPRIAKTTLTKKEKVGGVTLSHIKAYIATSEKAMAPHSSTLAWEIPWTEEPGGLQSIGLQRAGHD